MGCIFEWDQTSFYKVTWSNFRLRETQWTVTGFYKVRILVVTLMDGVDTGVGK